MTNTSRKTRPLPPIDYLRQRLTLSSESPTGLLWAEGKKAGQTAGTVNECETPKVWIDGRAISAARLVVSLQRGFVLSPTEYVVTEDGNPYNLALSNLKVWDKEANKEPTQLTRKMDEGVYYYYLRVEGEELGRFVYKDSAQKCLRQLHDNELDGLPVTRSVIAKRCLSEDASRLHLRTNQY